MPSISKKIRTALLPLLATISPGVYSATFCAPEAESINEKK